LSTFLIAKPVRYARKNPPPIVPAKGAISAVVVIYPPSSVIVQLLFE
jgi:hypothetical protein